MHVCSTAPQDEWSAHEVHSMQADPETLEGQRSIFVLNVLKFQRNLIVFVPNRTDDDDGLGGGRHGAASE